jgi:hypothetical protein
MKFADFESGPGQAIYTPRSTIAPVLVVMVLIVSGGPAAAKDTLGDFEDEVEKSEGSDSGGDDHGHYDDSDDSDAFFAFLYVIAGSAGATLEHYAERRDGAPSAALLRVEGTYQALNNGDVDGYTVRGELVWAFIGVGGEFIGYQEGSPDQTFDFTTVEGLFRFSPHENFRVTLATGSRRLEGKRKTTVFEGGISVGVYPQDWLGLELDLRLADVGDNVLGDYRIGGLLRLPDFPFMALRGGYRVIQIQGETLHGGEIGVVFTW